MKPTIVISTFHRPVLSIPLVFVICISKNIIIPVNEAFEVEHYLHHLHLSTVLPFQLQGVQMPMLMDPFIIPCGICLNLLEDPVGIMLCLNVKDLPFLEVLGIMQEVGRLQAHLFQSKKIEMLNFLNIGVEDQEVEVIMIEPHLFLTKLRIDIHLLEVIMEMIEIMTNVVVETAHQVPCKPHRNSLRIQQVIMLKQSPPPIEIELEDHQNQQQLHL